MKQEKKWYFVYNQNRRITSRILDAPTRTFVLLAATNEEQAILESEKEWQDIKKKTKEGEQVFEPCVIYLACNISC